MLEHRQSFVASLHGYDIYIAMAWHHTEHTDDENITWAYLRALEWGNYPAFLLQPIVPLLLIFFPVKSVIISLIGVNILWAVLFRYKPFIRFSFLSGGVYFVRLMWFTCPIAAAYLYFVMHDGWTALLALLLPFFNVLIANLPPPQIGKIQRILLADMGYEKIAGEWRKIS